MIQFNLLPDVKVEFIKARRIKRLVTLASFALSAVSIFVLLLSLVTVDIVQKKSLRDLDTDIGSNTKTLKAIPDLDKILTVQNQLNTLTGLHDQKVAASRLFDYIAQITPSGVTMNGVNTDYTANTISLGGSAPNLDGVNQFVDTLKNTVYASYTTDAAGQAQQASEDAYFKEHNSYPVDSQSGKTKAFSSVVLSSFSKSDGAASYAISASFDPLIFSNTNNIELHVPSGTVTNTSMLFKADK